MEINPELKKDIIQRHIEMFEAYVRGDVDGFLFHLADNAILHGTAKGESFFSKDAAVAFYSQTANQVVDLIKLEHCNTEVTAFDHYWILNEDLVFYARTGDEWIEYGASRITEVWSPIGDQIMITHIHCSLPDSNTLEGEQFNVRKIWDENIRLQAAVNERTAELEGKNRELLIESALERVRSRTMAMQKSTELNEVAVVLFEQLRQLGGQLWGTGFALCNAGDGEDEFWFANEMGVVPPVSIPNTHDEVHMAMLQGWKDNREYLVAQKDGEALANHYRYLYSLPQMKTFFDPILKAGFQFPTWQQWHAAYFSKGYLLIITTEPYAASDIFKRFARVFDQAYTRFLDLQKAEEQAREGQVEASLERVRSASMAMQSSADLSKVAFLLFEEFKGLHPASAAELSRAFVVTVNEPAEMFRFFITTTEGAYLSASYPLPFTEPTNGKPLFDCWKNNDAVLINVLTGDVYKNWLDYLDEINLYVSPEIKAMAKRVNNYVRFSKGFLGITSLEPLADDGLSVLKRFAGVFDQAYTRFLDLQQAETNAREAIRQASIERVRGEIASMRTPEDLQRITPLVWNELNTLGVPFFRCGVFIVEESRALIHLYLSTPEGKAIANLHIGFGSSQLTGDIVENWRNKQVYTIHWEREDFKAWVNTLVAQGQLQQEEQYHAGSEPPQSLWLHFIPFEQGMLYVGSAARLTGENLTLVKLLANAFETAYARYEDFTRLETANIQIEKTLEDLRATQKQLVQSEKMASLGELTAGIAHEIQNPLNFVNNFSEVSMELIEEMKEELAMGNLQSVNEIASDIEQNLEKIHHHGKRADGIVKGMLQHSRSGTGQKELTDINALCDEYLRLAYHGLKARDKSFNAKFEMIADPNLPLVNVMQEELGRVVLNLINNAFYAVSEKAKTAREPYHPTVSVITRKLEQGLEISVEDNGNGIPDNILEKIFQPFFTTKPTGQGTGLGLSLSYDIVKAHGGEIAVEASGEYGTTFKVVLPFAG